MAKTVEELNAEMPRAMGATEVAKVLGVKQQNLNKVAHLPPAFQEDLARGKLWRADVIRKFAAARRRRIKQRSEAAAANAAASNGA